ncbi:MAG: L-alanine exporter AlaE [Synergistaceae bacterium]|jgi:hypothetical protein|nr:L-alanine exporter AlaE [Synergistaceae bacterium]
MGSIPRWKLFLADTLSMTVFSTVLCMSIEIGLAGLTFGQSLTARFAAVPTNLLTGRAYGLYRDGLFRILRTRPDSWFQAALTDTVSFLTFQVPLYGIVLMIAGASLKQMALSAGGMTVIFALAGRPYGIFLQACRKWILSRF